MPGEGPPGQRNRHRLGVNIAQCRQWPRRRGGLAFVEMPSGRNSAAVRVVDVSLWALGSALLVWAWRADRAWFEAHIFSRFCATDSAELSRAVLQRALGVILGLLVLFVAR